MENGLAARWSQQRAGQVAQNGIGWKRQKGPELY